MGIGRQQLVLLYIRAVLFNSLVIDLNMLGAAGLLGWRDSYWGRVAPCIPDEQIGQPGQTAGWVVVLVGEEM
jgi:hypothetical protein